MELFDLIELNAIAKYLELKPGSIRKDKGISKKHWKAADKLFGNMPLWTKYKKDNK